MPEEGERDLCLAGQDHRVQTPILAMMQGDSFIYGSPYLLKSLESLVSIVKAIRMNLYNKFE